MAIGMLRALTVDSCRLMKSDENTANLAVGTTGSSARSKA
jgi:hypothetical protein